MPLIFIHGVTVRSGVENNKDRLVRDALFRRLVFPSLFSDPSNVEISNPCWGDKAAKFYWNYASLPTGNEETFGTEDELAGLILGTFLGKAPPSASTILLEVARHSMQDVVDLLWMVSSAQVNDVQKADEFAQFAVHASNYVWRYPPPGWLEGLRNDEEFLNQFTYELQHYQETLSDHLVNIGSGLLRQGRAHLQNLVRQFGQRASDVFVNTSRQSLHKKFALFLGDIFVYLTNRGTPEKPGEIVATLLKSLDQAVQRQREVAADSKLIIVAHSMGGNIIYDILTAFRPHIRWMSW